MQQATPIDFQQARDFSSTMNITFRFLRQNIKGLAKSLLFFAAPAVLLGSVFYHELFSRMISLSQSTAMNGGASPFGVDEYYTSVNFWISLLAALVFMLLGGVFTISTTYAYLLVYQEKQTRHVDLGEVWRKSRSLFWRTFGTMFMYYLGMSTAMGMLLIPTAILVFVMSLVSPMLSAVAFLLYYLGLFVLCVYFAMLFFIRCREGIGFFAAVSRLSKLTRAGFWNTVLVGGVNVYIQLVFSSLFVIPWYVYIYLVSLHDVSTAPLASPGFAQEALGTVLFMIYSLAGILLTSVPLIGLAMQYYNLVEKAESKGLMARIATFGERIYTEQEHEDF
jgi:hypothetical protein